MEIPKGGSDGNKKAGQKNKKIVYSSRKKKSPPVTPLPPPAEIQTTQSNISQFGAVVCEEDEILKRSVGQNAQHLVEDNGNVLGNEKVASSCTADGEIESAANDVDIDIVCDWESADVGELV